MSSISFDLNMPQSGTVLFSIHIPKTAGTTFGKMLSSIYKEQFLYVYRSDTVPNVFAVGTTLREVLENQQSGNFFSLPQVRALIIERNIVCVHGHLYGENQSDIIAIFKSLGKKVHIVSFVREPISRAYSELCHNKIFNKSEDPINLLLKKNANVLKLYLKDVLPVVHIFHTEDFAGEVKKFGLEWNGEKDNVNLHKDDIPYDEESIYSYNEEDIELYEEILQRFPRVSHMNKRKNRYAISVQHVSKSFLVPHEKIVTLRTAFTTMFKKKSHDVLHALHDVSFHVKKGEFFGIVGRNGSGKSTLLKILAGVYTADGGSIEINGAISPFLELGIGFNPELSGRDNVYLNATVLGLTRKQIDEKFDSIVAFSELERFIDQKLKNYSSGMQVRLAFSVSIHANRDILLMDEVLAVGDTNFQSKCLAEFSTYKQAGKTVILVTHSIAVVERYCDRAMLIHNGKIIKVGSAQEVSNEYMYQNILDEEKRLTQERLLASGKEKRLQVQSEPIKVAKIKRLEFLDKDGNPKHVFRNNESLIIRIYFDLYDKKLTYNFGIAVYDIENHYLFGLNTIRDKVNVAKYLEQGYYEVIVKKIPFQTNTFYAKASIVGGDFSSYYDYLERSENTFKVFSDNTNPGIVSIDYGWN